MERKLALWFVAVMAIFAAADAIYVAVLAARGDTAEIMPYGAAIAVAVIAAWLTYQRNVKPTDNPPPQ